MHHFRVWQTTDLNMRNCLCFPLPTIGDNSSIISNKSEHKKFHTINLSLGNVKQILDTILKQTNLLLMGCTVSILYTGLNQLHCIWQYLLFVSMFCLDRITCSLTNPSNSTIYIQELYMVFGSRKDQNRSCWGSRVDN